MPARTTRAGAGSIPLLTKNPSKLELFVRFRSLLILIHRRYHETHHFLTFQGENAMVRRLTFIVIFLLSATVVSIAADLRPMAIEDLYRILRVSDPAVSPDGKWVVFTVTTSDVDANKNSTDLWLASTDGSSARQLTRDAAQDRRAAWSPDGKWIAFESTRSGSSQIWLMKPDGSDAKQLTNISTEASAAVWSPDGKMIAFVSAVYPEFSEKPWIESNELNRKKDEEKKKNPVKTRVFTRLFIRHWDTWSEAKRQHIFVQPVGGGNARDLTPGDRDAVPSSSTFSAGIDYGFSPDSKEIAYTATPVENEAWNTNHDLYVVPVTGGAAKQITTNPAADAYPRYSPDGKYVAYRAQEVPGFESDRWQIWIYDRSTGKTRSITSTYDASVGSPVWAPDSRSLYFDGDEKGSAPLYQVTLDGVVSKIVDQSSNGNITVSADGKTLVFAQHSLVRAAEVYKWTPHDRKSMRITKINDDLFAQINIPAGESVWYEGAGGTKVQAWLLKPPGFDASKKYPLVYMVHGGPQSAWHDGWHYRWNLALWAAQGYVILAPNPRGSTGFGQKFTNEISKDWTGKVFEDLVKGIDYAESLPFVDRSRKAAAGASFGGFMMHWFAGHLPDRFKTIIVHDGTFNTRSQWGSTEELWFDEYEHGGTPWDNPESYDKISPDRYASAFKTPMLIIHGEMDFRIPYEQAIQAFTTMQRKGIPSKLVLFPDENHWVLKPGNGRFWHQTVFDWLEQYLK